MLDAALIFYPIATGALAFTGMKLYRKHKESQKETNTAPTTSQQ
jgi:uncharacterized membrane protein YebE (DUF533 family)